MKFMRHTARIQFIRP